MSERNRLLELLVSLAYEKRPITLSSGKVSDFYIDIKQAALTASRQGPFKPYYERLLGRGLSEELVRVTVARKIAAVTLAVWKKGARFDPEKILKPTT